MQLQSTFNPERFIEQLFISVALPRDESGVQRLGKSWVLFRIADAVVGMISGAELGKLRCH
jgi:hypothetical protein